MRLGSVVLAFGCLAAMAGSGLAQEVGVAAAVNQNALGTPPSAKPRTVVLGDRVIHNEKIETNAKGLLQILLADGTSFTVGPSSSMAIDSFVYDPAAGTAKVVATFGKGVFRFIGGKTSKTPDGATLNTPVGTVGIRGGIGDFDFSGGHGLPDHIDLLFGNSITLADLNGKLLGRLYKLGYSLVIGANGSVSIEKTPPAWTVAFQQNVTSHGGQHGGTSNSQSGNETEVADALGSGGGPGGGAPPSGGTPPGGGTTTTVADTGTPNPPFTPPDEGSPGETFVQSEWPDINNSDLAGVEATYTGAYGFTTTYDVDGGSIPDYSDTGEFSLAYHFSEANGGGTMTVQAPSQYPGGGSVQFDVNPDSQLNSGPATFSHYDDGSPPPFSGVQNGDFSLTGQFYNSTTNGAARGVAGTFTGSGEGYYGDGQYGTATSTGAFGGALTGTAPYTPPPP